jgi:hypothetical protein
MIKSHEDQLQLVQEEDMLYEAALEGARIQGAATMLDLQLGVTVQASPAAALAVYRYARDHESGLGEYEDDTIIAAQQERYVQY